MTEPHLQGWRTNPKFVVTLIVFLGYFAIARGVENFYPFSTFPMYSEGEQVATSRVMAYRSDFGYREVTEFHAWNCNALPTLETTTCDGVGGIAYIDREREQYVRSHPGTGGIPIELVRRVFSFDGVVRVRHCVLVQCTGVAE